jgi:preprotein translocase subunit SecA
VIAHFLKFIFGTANQRKIKQLYPLVNKINSLEPGMIELSNSELALKTNYFKEKLNNGSTLEDILPEAFAVVRESAKRFLNQRHYDVQLMGGIILSQGKIAEMKTGEGKTLTATLALYLNALVGKGVHLVTANDYLAKRDSQWMSPIYTNLGMSISSLQNEMYDTEKKRAYQSDILHGTSSEFGFDYLRDNMKFNLNDYIQRELFYALVDEVDSVLIDEARTPLIISGQADEESNSLILDANRIIKRLTSIQEKELLAYKKELAFGSDQVQNKIQLNQFITDNLYFSVDEKERHSSLTEKGVDMVEEFFNIKNLFSVENIKYLHYITQALKAHVVFKRDIDYLVHHNEVMIIDDNTGRILAGRRYSDGLHQAIEAKEGVDLQAETQTLASITIQNYFKLYTKIAGMTGTALTEAEEFHKIYKLDVVSMPTNKVLIRKDMPDYIFLTEKSKFKKIVSDIKERHEKGQPVLIGTIAVETSEKLSDALRSENIPHDILNAKQHAREADIIFDAGQKGKITIATNMAGRGTDIKLSDEARASGGLFILGTERHESRRIDNQLRGRAGRQGDPGESRFYISLEDTLIRRFGRDALQKAMIWGGMNEDDIIEDDMISDQIEVAQEKIEKENFESRRQLIDYDSVLNHQRIIVYGLRRAIITGGQSLMSTIEDFFIKAVEHSAAQLAEINNCDIKNNNLIESIYLDLQEKIRFESTDIEFNDAYAILSKKSGFVEFGKLLYDAYLKKILSQVTDQDESKAHIIFEIQKWVMLETLDYSWRQHIVNLDQIKEGISLRSWGQKSPLIEYKQEAFQLFKRMTRNLVFEIISKIGLSNDFDINALKSKRIQEMNEIEELLFDKNEQEKKQDIKKNKIKPKNKK